MTDRSAFFQIGLNRTEAKKRGIGPCPAWINPIDGSLLFVPAWENHVDPDLTNLTYGDDWQRWRLMALSEGDWAWFIVSACVSSEEDWGYHMIFAFKVEARYSQPANTNDWKGVPEAHFLRIQQSPH